MKKLLTIISVAAILASCAKSGTSTTSAPKPDQTLTELSSKVASTPMASYITMLSGLMKNPNGKGASNTSVSNIYSWTNGQYSVQWDYTTVGSRYEFWYKIFESSNLFYSIDGWMNTDGSAGHMVGSMNTSAVSSGTSSVNMDMTLDWTRDASGAYDMTENVTVHSGGSTTSYNYTAHVGADGHGTYTINGQTYNF